MSRFASRVIALFVLLIHSGVYGAAVVLDQIAEARATAQAAHIEADSGRECGGHDEAGCGLCQVRLATGHRSASPFTVVAIARYGDPGMDAPVLRGSFAHSGLHSRAPPVA